MKMLLVVVLQCIIGRQTGMVCLCLSNGKQHGGEGDECRTHRRAQLALKISFTKAGQRISLVSWTEGKLPLLTNLNEIVAAHFCQRNRLQETLIRGKYMFP